jgi:alpha/beta superfamily hydrolase
VGDSSDVVISDVKFAASDGTVLVGDVAVPGDCRAGAIVCHPHPQFGGDRHNHVVTALFEALPAAGIAALRFDFRRDVGEGIAEVDDARAAVDPLAREVPGVPIMATGYSFGAVVALALAHEQTVGKVLVAPPLRGNVRQPGVPTLVLTPANDRFCPPEVAEVAVRTFPDAELKVIENTDHFRLFGFLGGIRGGAAPSWGGRRRAVTGAGSCGSSSSRTRRA